MLIVVHLVAAIFLNLGNLCLASVLFNEKELDNLSNTSQMISRCLNLISYIPNNRQLGVNRNLSVLNYRLGFQDRAIAGLKDVLSDSPQDSLAHFWMGLAMLSEDRERAVLHLRLANAAAYFFNQAHLVPVDQAVDVVEVAMDVDIECSLVPSVYFDAADVVMSVKPKMSIELARCAALPTTNQEADFYRLIAGARYNMGAWEEAVEVSREGLRIYPENADIHYWFALSLWARDGVQALEEVAENLEIAYSLYSSYQGKRDALTELGNIYTASGDLTEAVYWYEQLVRVASGSPYAYHRLGKAYLRVNDAVQAESILSYAIERWPDLERLRFTLANAHLLLGDDDQACEQFWKAKSLLEESLDSYQYRSEINSSLIELCDY
jgi:tetratricopeptide (TPR) repeat protein